MTTSKNEVAARPGEADWWSVVGSWPSSTLQRRNWTFLLLLGALILFNFIAPADPTLLQRFLASGIILVASLPALIWLSGKEHAIPSFPMISAFYVIHYALPIFFLHRYSVSASKQFLSFPDAVVEWALLLTLAGMAAMLFGYYGYPGRVLGRLVPKGNFAWPNEGRVKSVSVLFAVVGIMLFLGRHQVAIPLALDMGVNLMTDLALIAIIALLLLQLTGRLGPIGKAFLWSMIGYRAVAGLGTSSVAEILRLLIPLVLAYAAVRHRIPWKVLLIGAVLFFLLRPVKGEPSVVHSGNLIEDGIQYIWAAVDMFKESNLSLVEYIRRTWWRLAYIMKFSQVIELTPSEIPFWGGHTYYPILFKPIPRIIFPDKPQETTGFAFGHRYGFLGPGDVTTAVNFPLLVEFYANFGLPAAIAGMWLIGLLFRGIDSVFIHRGLGLGGLVFCIFIYGKLGHIGQNLSAVLGQLIYYVPLFIIIHFIMRGSPRRGLAGEDTPQAGLVDRGRP